jgi:hypothetical protein
MRRQGIAVRQSRFDRRAIGPRKDRHPSPTALGDIWIGHRHLIFI